MKEEIEDTEDQSRMFNIQLRGVQEGRDRTMKMENLGKVFGRVSKPEKSTIVTENNLLLMETKMKKKRQLYN